MAGGSFGLSVQLAVSSFPFYLACSTGNEQLIETFVKPHCDCTDGSIRGCWGITEPEHGSDVLAAGEDYFSSPTMKGGVRGRIEGDELVINGQKSAWVSGGTIATHTLLHFQLDPEEGFAGSGVCIVPLDLKGVSKGKPLEKLGQHDLYQGEIYFDEVRVPLEYLLIDPDFYVPALDTILTAAKSAPAST